MHRQIIRTLLVSIALLTLIRCNNRTDSLTNTIKLRQNDPFKSTIAPSQFFDLDGKKDNVVEGENGTVVVCPKGCFKNSKGEIIEKNIKIELSEALSLESMLLSNLTTTSNGKPLETDGMIYFNATSNGEQLIINKDNPIHIEIPTTEKKPGMKSYKGIRDENGNMNWTDPKELDKFLVSVDINLLDFLPQGFQTEVANGMPFKKYKSATQSLTDSLYYSLSASNSSLSEQLGVPTNYNEPYYNKNKKIVNGKYTNGSYEVTKADTVASDKPSSKSNCGIDPAIIKVIKSEKYQNTLIATREFETRLNVIFKTCKNSVLEVYIKNLDKNLYELDSMAAYTLGESQYHKDLQNFSDQRLTNVKEASKYTILLKEYFEDRLLKVKAELESTKEKFIKILDKKNEEAQKVADNYKKLLLKREKFRMETYGFNWTETGWVNIDNGTIEKDWGPQPLQIFVDNGKQFDRVYTYVVYSSIKSLYRLNSSDQEQFYVGNADEKQMLMPKKKSAVGIAIGYKGEIPSLAIKEFETGEPKFSMTLSSSTIDQIKQAIRQYNKYEKENKISEDLKFMDKFFIEEQRQKVLQKENEFIYRLLSIAYPCCEDPAAVMTESK